MQETITEPQWEAVFVPEREVHGYVGEIDCAEPNAWHVSVDEAREASLSDFLEPLLDTRDPRLPLIALSHHGPYSLELHCTGCGEHTAYGGDLDVDDHHDCAPNAPEVDKPTLTGPELSRQWAAALRESSLLEQVAIAADDGAVPHTIELRFEVMASPERVGEIAAALASITGGTHTATFDENWNEPE